MYSVRIKEKISICKLGGHIYSTQGLDLSEISLYEIASMGRNYYGEYTKCFHVTSRGKFYAWGVHQLLSYYFMCFQLLKHNIYIHVHNNVILWPLN